MNYFFGFSIWKHNFIKPFFPDKTEFIFINPISKKNYFKLALKKGLDKNSNIYIWGKKSFPLIEEFAKKNNNKIYRIEDGFIRSLGLGSDLTQPYSLVIDSRGIYFDPTSMSDLEYIIKNSTFDDNLLKRAKYIKDYLVEKKLSKYNLFQNQKLAIQTDKKIVLVLGQVEDDASIKYGANGMTNLELIKKVKDKVKNSYIIYKPHPDVLVGNRIGHVDEKDALLYVDKIVTDVGIDSVLEISDEVHTMTSLVGFEALMRDKKVFVYGKPFYAGWGLTHDDIDITSRDKKISLLELIASTLILYPKYIDPFTLKETTPEKLLDSLDKKRELFNNSISYRIKSKIYSFITRKLQLFFYIIYTKNQKRKS